MNSVRHLAALLAIASFVLFFLSAVPEARGQTEQLTFQGFLTDSNGDPLGGATPVNTNVTFRIFDAATGGNKLWAEGQTATVDNGHFSVLLGEGTPVEPGDTAHDKLSAVFDGANASWNRYLEMEVDGTAMKPRIQFLPVPYALVSKSSSQLVDNSGLTLLTAAEGTVTVIGTLSASGANLTNLDASNITSGTLNTNRLPGFDASKITTGRLDQNRLPGSTTIPLAIEASASNSNDGGIQIRPKSGSTGGHLHLGINSTYSWIQSHNSQPLVLNELANDVGIGKTDPQAKLDIASTQNHLMLTSTRGHPNNRNWRVSLDHGLEGNFEIAPSTAKDGYTFAPAAALAITKDGLVGIGESNPSRAKLEVRGSDQYSGGGYGYLNRGGANVSNQGANGDFSIWASHRIGADEFNAFSDARRKRVIGRSDPQEDLATLLGIQITDYSFIDVMQQGNRMSKKVIAQQVEKVYPEAVSKITDVVPDIYKVARIENGWVGLATDLKPGEMVSVITDQERKVSEVLEVDPHRFRVHWENTESEVFVYGREVSDFRVVDYDALSMLNISATQRLHELIQEQRELIERQGVRIAELREENEQLRASQAASHRSLNDQVDALRAAVDELKKAQESKLARQN